MEPGEADDGPAGSAEAVLALEVSSHRPRGAVHLEAVDLDGYRGRRVGEVRLGDEVAGVVEHPVLVLGQLATLEDACHARLE